MNVDAVTVPDLNVDAAAAPEINDEDNGDDGEGDTSEETFSSEDLGNTMPKKRTAEQLLDGDFDHNDFKSPSTKLTKSNSLGKPSKSPKSPRGIFTSFFTSFKFA